jgi:hypothetical protein
MHVLIGNTTKGAQLYLSNCILFDDQGNRSYFLLELAGNSDSYGHKPHNFIVADNRLAGDFVHTWMQDPARTESEIDAAKSFLGFDTTGYSDNQLIFISEAKRQGVPVNNSFEPSNTFGRTCPAIRLSDCKGGVFHTNVLIDSEMVEEELVIYCRG